MAKKTKKAKESVIDINEMFRQCGKDIRAVQVTGFSTIAEIRTGFYIAIDMEREPKLNEAIYYVDEGKTWVDRYRSGMTYDGVIVSHASVYVINSEDYGVLNAEFLTETRGGANA